jgi:2-dehydro-3-deoxyphosphogluconate aldolase/(4S)-4-hydroxy-2-oxoglutarate aldolase
MIKDTHARLESERLLGVIRAPSADEAMVAGEAALAGGLGIIEFTMNTPGVLGLVERFADGPHLVGAGTVTDSDEAESAIGSGAQFIVTPVATRSVIDTCRRLGVVVICGASTPTEIWNAHRWGSDLVKVFPIATLGGADYLRLLRGPFPDIPILVTGGVDAASLGGLYEAGAQAAGVTTALFDPELLARRDGEAIRARTGEFLAIRARHRPRQ